MKGTVTRVIYDKRFGFIKGEDNKEYFFHMTDFIGSFEDLVTDFEAKRSIPVEFNSVSTPKGMRADTVTRMDG